MDYRPLGRTGATGTVVPMFSLAERDRRWDLARSFMDREGLDALLVFGEHEDAGPAPFCLDTWFTNDRPGAIVVFPRTGEPTPPTQKATSALR